MFFRLFRDFLSPCEAMRQVKKQQIKVKFWIWGPRTVYYTTCNVPTIVFKNHSTLAHSTHWILIRTETVSDLGLELNSIRLLNRSGSCNLDPKHDLFLCCSLEKKFSTVCTVESLKQYCFNVKNARSLIFVHANQEIFYQIHICLTGYENKPGNNPIVFGWIYLSGSNSVVFG